MEYPYLDQLTNGEKDHPLNVWVNSDSAVYQSACAILDGAVRDFNAIDGFDKLILNIKRNKNHFWSYLPQLYISYGLIEYIVGKVFFEYDLPSGKNVDLYVQGNRGNTAIEISTMLRCKNLNILLDHLFCISNEFKIAIEIEYINDDIPGLDYKTMDAICKDFQKKGQNSQSLTYLSGAVKITKTSNNYSVASSTCSNVSISEYKLKEDIIEKILEEEKQLRHSGSNLIVLEMQHYYNISPYYFDCFTKDLGGYNEIKSSLLNDIPETINAVIFWWTSIDKKGPFAAYVADKKNNSFRKIEAREIADYI